MPTYITLSLIVLQILCIGIAPISLAQKLPTGAVLDTVQCLKDKKQSYAIYLPSKYTPDTAWPAVFIFEPAARGVLPVKKYAKVAEELGYILISSNNSKNGSWEIAFEAGDAMFLDAFERYNIATDRVYTSGFSGGGRVATSVAVLTGKIAGVISCGAGMPNLPHYRPVKGSKINYVSLVGNRDMNYLELLVLEEVLNNIALSNKRIVFDGIHEWPPSSFFREALLWMELQYALDNGVKDYDYSESFALDKKRGDSLLSARNYLESHRVFVEMKNNYSPYLDTNEMKDILAEIKGQRTFKKQQRTHARIVRQEKEYQSKLFRTFRGSERNRLKPHAVDSTAKTKEWWFSEIDRIKKMAAKENIEKRMMGQRLLNLVWAHFAEASFSYAVQGDLELACELNKLWLYAEPHSAWGHWSIAKLYGEMAEVDPMLDHLNKVREINPGLSKQSIVSQPVFAKYTSNNLVQQFLEQLK